MLQDYQLTWNTSNPDLTPCFEKTVLVWAPCGFLWLGSILDIYYSYANKSRQIPRSPLNVAKIIVTLLLIILDVIMLQEAIFPREADYIYPVDLVSPVVKISTYVSVASSLSVFYSLEPEGS